MLKAATKPPVANVTDDRLIPRRQACRDFLGIGTSTGYRRERDDPNFPRAVKIGKNRWAYRLSEIQRYIDSLPRRSVA